MLRLVCLLIGLTLAVPARAAPDEAEVLREWNALRADPPAYARYLEAWLPLFRGLESHRPSGRILTREGPAAVREAIAALRVQKPLSTLQLSAGMTRAAREHLQDLGPKGGLGHVGSDGSTVGARLSRHGQWQGTAAEAIDFGATTAREAILELLVDDGVPGRGHRAILLHERGGKAGIACGHHRDYRTMCVLDLTEVFVEAQPAGPARPAPTPLDDSKPFATPVARMPTGAPTALDLAVFAEVNALRTDPAAWAGKLKALLPLFKGAVLQRPGRVDMYWHGAPDSVVQAIAMLEATAPVPPAQLLPGLAAGARDYVRVRELHPAFIDRYFDALTTARRYGAGPLGGVMTMQGEGEAFDIVATWVVKSRGPNPTLLRDADQVGVACGPGAEQPLMCALVYGKTFRDHDATELALLQAALQRLDAARTDPQAEAERWRQLLPKVKGDTVQLPGGVAALPGGREAMQKLIARLTTARPLPPLVHLGELQARARDLVVQLAPGRMPGDAGSWTTRSAWSYGQPEATREPDELVVFAPGSADLLALRALLAQPEWFLGREQASVGLWCGSHAKQGQACVIDVAVDWAARGPALP